jgi:hypothetical protein
VTQRFVLTFSGFGLCSTCYTRRFWSNKSVGIVKSLTAPPTIRFAATSLLFCLALILGAGRVDASCGDYLQMNHSDGYRITHSLPTDSQRKCLGPGCSQGTSLPASSFAHSPKPLELKVFVVMAKKVEFDFTPSVEFDTVTLSSSIGYLSNIFRPPRTSAGCC